MRLNFAICRWHNCTSFWCSISIKIIWFIIAFRKVLWSKTKSNKIWNAMAWPFAPQKRYHSWSPWWNERRASLRAWVHFTYDIEVSEKKNFFEKLGSLKKTLNMWFQRDLSIVGRINIIKTLALSKLVFICSVMNTPKDFSKEVNKITFDFIWNHKPAKIKKDYPYQAKNSWWLGHEGFFSLRQSA